MLKRISTVALTLVLTSLAAMGCDGPGEDAKGNANGNGRAAGESSNTTDGGAPAVRAPQVQPLQAVFIAPQYTTRYTASVVNPDQDELIFTWSGPHCGPVVPDSNTCRDATCTPKMTWMHQSPPCPEHADHLDTTIVFQAIGKKSGRVVQCTYRGAETGTGPACFQSGFGGTELGSPNKNNASIRYHIPLDTQCHKVDLVQVLHIERNGRTVIPHNDGMVDTGIEGNLLGYQEPLPEDDVDGYVVDKFKSDITTSDPYYSGAVSGTPDKDAELDDRPGNTAEGHVAHFEVCAFCSGNPGDAQYGKYLGCYTWEHDADTGAAKMSTPQPTGTEPSDAAKKAIAKWNENKHFTMPK